MEKNALVKCLWCSVEYEEACFNAYESASEAKQLLAEYFRFYNENGKHQVLMAAAGQADYESIT